MILGRATQSLLNMSVQQELFEKNHPVLVDLIQKYTDTYWDLMGHDTNSLKEEMRKEFEKMGLMAEANYILMCIDKEILNEIMKQ